MVLKCCQGYATLCRVFTYGFFLAAVVFSCFALGSCEFVTRGDLTIGLFRFSRDGSECMEYSDANDFEQNWLHNWARVSGLMAVLLGALVVVLMGVDCCADVCCSKYMQIFLVVCCQLSQGFTFIIWVSDACFTRKGGGNNESVINRGCRIGDGSIYSFNALMLYMIGGFFLCCSPKPNQLLCKKDDDNDGKKCCGKDKKDKKSDNEDDSDEKQKSQEDKPNDEEDPVVAAAVVKEVEKEEEPEQIKDIEQTKDEENPEEAILEKEAPDEEAPEKEDEGDVEAPAVVPIPVVVPVVTPISQPEESGTEVEFDGEFGTSQIRAPMY